MSEKNDQLALGVRALRELTGKPADGRASRARVLVRAACRVRQRRRLRLAGLVVLVVLAVPSASAGFLHAWRTWRSLATRATTTLPAQTKVPRAHTPSTAWLPSPEAPTELPATASEDAPMGARLSKHPSGARAQTPEQGLAHPHDKAHASEFVVYERAHRSHFHQDHAAEALRLWEAYLEQFPSGRFLPEARFNRAVCLVRLDKLAQARETLAQILAQGTTSDATEQAARLLAKLGHR
jgi:TolA-binding protein